MSKETNIDVDQYQSGWNAARDGKEHREPVSLDYTRGYQAFRETERVMKGAKVR